MKQLFKAVDSLDNEPSWFFFDGEGKFTSTFVFKSDSPDGLIRFHKKFGASLTEKKGTRDRMINPELVAEWE